MNKFESGLKGAFLSIVTGLVSTAIVDSFTKTGAIPSFSPLIFGIVSFFGNLVTINSFQELGISYTFGWLIGAYLLKDGLSFFDNLFNIGGPILILVLRFWSLVRDNN